ncbi:SDR family NAD(P)-dependent oxidoreductase [Phytomonospora endophytica]|uniref:NAD(P)-dependent dehydrogenase (Short-subunit alcohol dehydrogenase family) n=1 Tax=Phytomonospora endophytica TaxID=714109 RepID=A0A841FST2_9ACTN|nr:SDR family oxidoreductase [Phytomonospora endophytica]MBB6038864.1 NAD(P)-dependent dehydrogenase (short-subunit alcohol dehydrogenase family) [Phytomonospora endophytica]GIG68341.1 short-chain dehydrogenase [Phytomonospora endophytica]
MSTLQGKRAVVTGAASGIGRATAELMAELGASVAVVDRDEAGAKAVAEGIGGIAVATDVASAADCERAVATAVEAFGGLDVLVNNAGIIRRSTVLDITEDDWDLVMAVNVKSVMLMSRFAIPHLVAAGGGSIVNTGSGWGIKGGGQAVSYCASKGAVVNLTRAMAIDHGPDGIRVNCVCPGDTATGMLAEEARQLGESADAFYAEAADRPLRRIGQPRDIAEAIAYLAGDGAAFVSGAVLTVDGAGTA